jgi:hypothetical protein
MTAALKSGHGTLAPAAGQRAMFAQIKEEYL